MSDYLIGEIEYNARITRAPCAEVVDGGGEGRLEWLGVRDTNTGEEHRTRPAGCSCCSAPSRAATGCPRAGPRRARLRAHRPRRPRAAWVDGLPPANLATPVPGIFAAGDIRAGSMKRVAAASGEGASVVPLVHG